MLRGRSGASPRLVRLTQSHLRCDVVGAAAILAVLEDVGELVGGPRSPLTML